jgi:hypothetical protein
MQCETKGARKVGTMPDIPCPRCGANSYDVRCACGWIRWRSGLRFRGLDGTGPIILDFGGLRGVLCGPVLTRAEKRVQVFAVFSEAPFLRGLFDAEVESAEMVYVHSVKSDWVMRAAEFQEWLANGGQTGTPPGDDRASTERPTTKPKRGKTEALCIGMYLGAIHSGKEPPSAKEIADSVGCNRGTASRAIKPLEDERREAAKLRAKDRHEERGGPKSLRNK